MPTDLTKPLPIDTGLLPIEILAQAGIPVAAVSFPQGIFTRSNDRFTAVLQATRPVVGLTIEQVFPADAVSAARACFTKLESTHVPSIAGQVTVDLATGPQPFDLLHLPMRDDRGDIESVLIIAINAQERLATEMKLRRALATQEALLREVTHRVKNSLQAIASLVALKANQSPSMEVREALAEVRDRIIAVGQVHNAIHAVGDGARVAAEEVIRGVATAFQGNAAPALRFVIGADCPVPLGIDEGVRVGLILNELLTNATKYAYPDAGGEIRVSARCEDDLIIVAVSDEGVGLSAPKADKSGGHGFNLIGTLAESLNGSISITSAGQGTSAVLRFPKPSVMLPVETENDRLQGTV